jgi:hypothetical protein
LISVLALLATGLIAAVLDGLLTLNILRAGGHEINPLFKRLITNLNVNTSVVLTRLVLFALMILVALVGDRLLLLAAIGIPVAAVLFNAVSIAVTRM